VSPDQRHEAVVVVIAGGRALWQLDNGERPWIPVAPHVAVGARAILTGRGFRAKAADASAEPHDETQA
jgi:hypothetical protein